MREKLNKVQKDNIKNDSKTDKKAKKKKTGKFFKVVTPAMKKMYKKPQYIYFNKEPLEDGAIYVSNHVGTTAPLKYEFYFEKPFAFWGACEMTGSLRELYKYQSKVYYHEKKKKPLWLARIMCLACSPITYFFYKGLRVISIYRDAKFRTTLQESVEWLESNKSLIIFPEDSEEGYLDVLKGFHSGFLVLAEYYNKKTGKDVSIYPLYYYKQNNVQLVGEKESYLDLKSRYKTKEDIAEYLKDKTNELKTKYDNGDYPKIEENQ